MKRAEITAALPIVFGLSRVEAAASIGVSPTVFDQMVVEQRMPQPRRPSVGRLVWDVDELRSAFKALPHREEMKDEAPNPWDDL
jgi:hypothetical protein